MSRNHVEDANDRCLHARYWYYVKTDPIYTDAVYNIFEAGLKWYVKEYPDWDREGLECYKVGSDREDDYPKWVKDRKPLWPKNPI